MKTYRAAVVGCSRMGAFIDNEVIGQPGHVPPFSHAAAFYACERTDLIACSDLRTEVMKEAGRQYDIPKQRQFTDYKVLIDQGQPDIVSVATQPEHRAEVVIYAAEHGVKAVYAEKALSASMAEADAILEACERNGVFLNLGTQLRWHPGFTRMREVIDSGRLGALKTVIFGGNALFNGASHRYDNLLFLNGDRRALWVQMSLVEGDWAIEGDRLTEDPVGHGIIHFENGVTAYALLGPREFTYQANCEHGSVTAMPDHTFKIRVEGPPGYRARGEYLRPERAKMVAGRFARYKRYSANLRLVEDLVHSLDSGEPPVGGVRTAHASTELIFATIESHLRGGSRVALPLEGSTVKLKRDRAPRQPRIRP